MLTCPRCGLEVLEKDNFCRHCGGNLPKIDEESGPEGKIKSLLVQRIDGIKNKDIEAIKNLADEEKYTKFDDWPPFELQGLSALNRERDAYEVLEEYYYETDSWKIGVFENCALASFIINYRGKIRNQSFNVRSRVTGFLVKKASGWKLIHEHWSRFPERRI